MEGKHHCKKCSNYEKTYKTMRSCRACRRIIPRGRKGVYCGICVTIDKKGYSQASKVRRSARFRERMEACLF